MLISTSPEKFADYMLALILLSVVESKNPDFLLNNNEKWVAICKFLADHYKGHLLKFYFDFEAERRSRFATLKRNLYKDKFGTAEFKIINSKNNSMLLRKEEPSVNEIVDIALTELAHNNLLSKDAFDAINNKRNKEKFINKINDKLMKEYKDSVQQ